MAVGFYPLHALLAYLSDEVPAVVKEVVAIHAVTGIALTMYIVFAPACGHVLARAEMSGLYLVERDDAPAGDASAGSAWHGIAEADVELEDLVEFICVLALVFDWTLGLYLRSGELVVLFWTGAKRCLAEERFRRVLRERFLSVHWRV